MDNSEILNSFFYIFKGLFLTLQYTFFSVLLGSCFGFLLSLCKLSNKKLLKILASIYTSIFRGTPMLLQLTIIYYVIPGIIGFKISPFIAGVTTFSFNSAAYISEIIRSGIESVDKSQIEAANSLGISYFNTMKDIIFPQAFRKILPNLMNEVIDMLKESSIISTIGQADLMRRAQIIAAEHYSYLIPLFLASICYYVPVLILTKLSRILEEKIKLK